MIYDFQLHFTGLCLFRRDSSVHVLLANTSDPESAFPSMDPEVRPHKHSPRLVIDPRFFDASSREPDGLSVGPDGRDWALFDLSWEKVSVTIPMAGSVEIPKGRKPADRDPYQDPGQTGARPDWFDWTISIPSVGETDNYRIRKLKDSCWDDPSPDGPVTTRVRLLGGGTLQTSSHSRIGDECAIYDYISLDDTSSKETSHVFADRVTLSAHGLDTDSAVKIETPKGSIQLRPPDGEDERRLVQASITNMDVKYHRPDKRIYDFLWYYRLFDWSPEEPSHMKMPVPRPPMIFTKFYTPSSTTCPPGGG